MSLNEAGIALDSVSLRRKYNYWIQGARNHSGDVLPSWKFGSRTWKANGDEGVALGIFTMVFTFFKSFILMTIYAFIFKHIHFISGWAKDNEF